MLRRLIGLRRASSKSVCPQPTPWTHEGMKEEEVIAGISKNVLAGRRRSMIQQIIGSDINEDEAELKPLVSMILFFCKIVITIRFLILKDVNSK